MSSVANTPHTLLPNTAKASKAVDSVSPMLMIHSALHQGWTVSLADHEGSKVSSQSSTGIKEPC